MNAPNMRIQPTASLAALAPRAADARAVMRRAASGARSGARVLCRARAQRRVCGRAVLCGSARVAGVRGRVRWLCPIHKPHNKRIQPTASLAALARGG